MVIRRRFLGLSEASLFLAEGSHFPHGLLQGSTMGLGSAAELEATAFLNPKHSPLGPNPLE